MAQKRGLIQVYTGQGKGKTTAALGLALRAAGHGLRVEIVQFLKGWPGYGELKGVDWLPTVAIHAFGRSGWIHPDHPEPEDFDRAANALAFAHQLLAGGDADIVILDEVNVALDYGLLSLADLLGLLDAKPPAMELILTGRNAPPALIQRADLVTEMRLVKHPYDQGIKARRGVEF